MHHKGQPNGVLRHNLAWKKHHSLKSSAYLFFVGLMGFFVGVFLVNWCKVSVISHCGLKGMCCKEIRLGPEPSPEMDAPESETEPSSLKDKDDFIFVGIMTAKKFIDNRGLASHRTWASNINGKVMFFSSEGSSSSYDVPVVALPDVDDHYPPQKKSFMMIKYMHDHFLDKYEWFMRADDDVFIKGDKLDEFLRGINSSQARFIGQAGIGKADELGKLSLTAHENFCMGGPGMIFSRETLRRMAPHISYCLQNLYTSHEDVEIGRCVRKFAGIQCTWAYEMQQILYQNYKEDKGSFKNTLKNKEVQKAVSLHPVKDPDYQYHIYNYLRSVRVMQQHQREVQLHRDLAAMTEFLEDGWFLPEPSLSQKPSLIKFRPLNGKEVIPWEYLARSIFSPFNNNPRRGIDESVKGALDELVNQIIMKVNKNAHLRGRTIDFKEIRYGYQRLDPMHGPDYILDLLLTYKKYRGKKVSMNVRRHAYLQRTFLPLEMKEDPGVVPTKEGFGVGAKVKSWLHKFSGQGDSPQLINKRNEHIDIIMPLMGRYKIFQRFMNNFVNVCLLPQENVKLVVVLYHAKDDPDAFKHSLDLIYYHQDKYGKDFIEVVQTNSEFSRGPGLQLGAERCHEDSLLFFVDVDIIFSSASLDRIRLNTRRGSQVYFPIVFSQYDPQPVCAPGSPHCDCRHTECVLKPEDVSEDAGYWRLFGFGIAALYRSDYHAVGGFDLSIRGWGKEDVDLYTKFIEHYYIIFRAADPGMTHIFHAIQCSDNLVEAQMVMCINSRAQSYASTSLLSNQIYNNHEILRRMEMHHINHRLK
ncbi:chondroitin sulfate synthase 1 [Aplysia californica]|uniref:Hexosyltransferase n=1 Tax=Aplysia californica TaxID=6500 RepID=A0ABM0JPL7_APLCA|nr:chondroitin sulfate synthase 1 [Aplysia californica]XP_005098573.1 chondroitin sulfate synthase 1 [Aplysia californica]